MSKHTPGPDLASIGSSDEAVAMWRMAKAALAAAEGE